MNDTRRKEEEASQTTGRVERTGPVDVVWARSALSIIRKIGFEFRREGENWTAEVCGSGANHDGNSAEDEQFVTANKSPLVAEVLF